MKAEVLDIRRIGAVDLVPSIDPSFHDTGILRVLRELMFGPNLILKGPKGTGKTLAVEQLAALEDIPLLRMDCSEDTSSRELLGMNTKKGDDIFFMLGILPAAIDIANEVGQCIVVLEEINALPPQSQKLVNSMADYRREVSIPKIGRNFRIKDPEQHKLWLVGTMNPSYGGTYNLNEDFRSRFDFIEIGYPGKEEEVAILEKFVTTVVRGEVPRDARVFIQRLLTLASETRSEKMEYALSTRDLVGCVRTFLKTNDAKALKLLEGKFEAENTRQFQTRVKSCFNIDLTGVKL